jgi:hypothetical protein
MIKFSLNLPCWKYEIRTEISQSHPNWSSLEIQQKLILSALIQTMSYLT